jgi:hypothetical protein
VVDFVHLFENCRLEIFLPALTANAGRNVVDNHKVFLTPIIVFNLFLHHLTPTIGAVGIIAHDLPPLILGSVHLGNVGL